MRHGTPLGGEYGSFSRRRFALGLMISICLPTRISSAELVEGGRP